jgi:hypothetical protein
MNIALTTPKYFSHLVRAASARQIAQAASFDLHAKDPDFCAKDGMTKWQTGVLTALTSSLAFVAPLAPLQIAATCMAALCLVFLLILWPRLSACGAASKLTTQPAAALADANLPVYSLIIALYREARVVPQLLAAISSLDYPRAKLDVKLVVEPDDHETLNALRRNGVPPFCEVIVAPPGFPRTKPRALNVALPLARGELVAVYDAEDIPDPQQLRLSAARFAGASSTLACLQARLAIDNIGDGWLVPVIWRKRRKTFLAPFLSCGNGHSLKPIRARCS